MGYRDPLFTPRRRPDPDDEFGPPPPPPTAPQPVYTVGLDLGQAADFSAVVAVEKTMHPDPDREGRTVGHFAVRHIHRWPLGTPYTAIVADVRGMFAAEPLAGSQLVVDETGVGKPVVDMFRAAGIRALLRPMTITGGESAGVGTVPKKSLVGAVQVPLQARRLKIASTLPLADTLAKELENFRVRVTLDRNETFSAWREREHDDLVLALALALYVASFPPGAVAVAQNGRLL